MPWKMQSIFVNGLRAPDTETKAVKKLVRWMRVAACHDADPAKLNCYMTAPHMNEDLINEGIHEVEYLTCHYAHHLADSLRVLSIYHPQMAVQNCANHIHTLIAEEIFHFVPESTTAFIHRHRDKVEHE